MKFYDYLDEIVYFISDNESHLGYDNLDRMKMIFQFELIAGALFTAFDYMFNPGFKLHGIYLLILALSAVFWRLTEQFQTEGKDSFRFVRRYATFTQLCMFAMAAFIDLDLRSNREALFFPILMVVSAVFYVDYLLYVAGFHLAVTVLFIVCDTFIKPYRRLIEDAVVVSSVFIVSMFCYFVILCIQTDTGRGNRELKHRSSTDLLTGLYNKIAFEEMTESYLNHKPKGTPCALLIFDFDFFKKVNDNYGHQAGDEALKFFAQTLHKSFRVNDYVGRVGGDEFMVLLTGVVPGGYIERRCDDILRALRGVKIGEASGFSASIGIAQDEEGMADFKKLYSVADRALYQAKENGRACFVKLQMDIRE